MARARKPRTDEQLAQEEREMIIERARQEIIDQQKENDEKLAAAGEPEAREAVEALQRVTRSGNVIRLNSQTAEALGITATAAEAPGDTVEDEREVSARDRAMREGIEREAFRRSKVKEQMGMEERGRSIMDLHMKRWAKEGERNFGKASRSLQLNVGKDAVILWRAGVFDSMLSIAQFIQRFHMSEKENREDDWADEQEKELRELRGDD